MKYECDRFFSARLTQEKRFENFAKLRWTKCEPSFFFFFFFGGGGGRGVRENLIVTRHSRLQREGK